jgi:hypothetical protein
MKLSVQTYIFLALIVVAFVAGFCSKGDNNFDKEIEIARRERDFHNQIADLNHRKENIAKIGLAYRDTLVEVRAKYAELLKRKEVNITNARKKVTKLKVIPLPQICDSLVNAQSVLVSELEGEIVILKEEKGATWNNFNEILKAEHEEKEILNAEVEEYKEALLFTQSDANHFKKKQRGARRQRNLAVVIGLVLIGLVATN